MKTSLLRGTQFHELKRLEKELFAELRSAEPESAPAIQRDICWVQKCLQEKMEDVKRS
jgi:hypothetical protein